MKVFGDIEQLVSTGVDGDGGKPGSSSIFKKVLATINSHPGLSKEEQIRLALLTLCNI